MRSPRRLQTCIRPSEYCTQNGNSSKKTLCHSFIQLCHSADQSRCLFLHCIVKENRSNALEADKPSLYKRLRTIRAKSGCSENMPISSLIVCDVVIRFCKAGLTNMSIFSALVMRGKMRSCMPFNMNLSNLLTPYSRDSGWISTSNGGPSVQYNGMIIQALRCRFLFLCRLNALKC